MAKMKTWGVIKTDRRGEYLHVSQHGTSEIAQKNMRKLASYTDSERRLISGEELKIIHRTQFIWHDAHHDCFDGRCAK